MDTAATCVNSPFVVGVVQADLDASQGESLAAAAGVILRELMQYLPHTEVRLMIETRGSMTSVLIHEARELGVSIEALPPGDYIPDILVRRSSLLLALWDGMPSMRPGDTADTVSRFLGMRIEHSDTAKAFEIATVLDSADVTAQLVYWVPAAPRGAVQPAEPVQPCFLVSMAENVMETQASMPESLRQRLADLDNFNADYLFLTSAGRAPRSESLLRTIPAELAIGDSTDLEFIDHQYMKADALANHMQSRSDRLFNLFGVMTFTMGLAYLVYDKMVESRLLLLGYMLALFASFLTYFFFQQKRWLGKHLSYRALAETLRIRFYLSLAGLDHRLHAGSLIALAGIHRFRGFNWIGCVLDAINPIAVREAPTTELYLRRTDFVEQEWIEAQYHYFVRKTARLAKDSRYVKRMQSVMLAAALADIAAMFAFGEGLNRVDVMTGLPIKNVLTFCSGFLATLLGVWELRHSKMATRELLWQYRNQLTQFARARVRLERTTARGARDELLIGLGEASLMETYLWAIHRYHREHSPPGAH